MNVIGMSRRGSFEPTLMDRRAFVATLAGAEASALSGGVGAARHPDVKALAGYGSPSPFEDVVIRRPHAASPALTPLGSQLSIITPSGLHFVRNHADVPRLDPRRHRLVVHGLVSRALSFSVADLLRFPAVERVHFIECAGNSARGYQQLGTGIQYSHGLVSCTLWTGVRLRDLLNEVGPASDARWFIAEGGDGSHFDVSIPLTAAGEALVVYGQNGEMLRPEQGYPMRLVLPGFEGSTHVKWLRRIKLVTGPAYSREETAQYAQRGADGKVRLFDFVMNVKSVITFPSPGNRLPAPGAYEGRGFAWSGRGRITRVEVSLDGGASWNDAGIGSGPMSKAFTRFTFPLAWDGRPLRLQSRSTDETGDVQPTLSALIAQRGASLRYHVNAIATWNLAPDGSVTDAAG